jgi:trigger factor
MQVSVERTSELSRKMTVSIPEEIISEKVEAKLKSLAREVKVAGFRPGKVPQNVIKAKFGAKARNDVTGEIIQSSYFDALKQQDLNPAGMPHIHPVESTEGFSYTAEFEVYPEIAIHRT